ncbi:aldehyde dehydrogenase (NAD+) (plasmid) [Azospirillum sp. B510]|nr:aldehyde dehydrogenase (NAD+) [Azospirillum sp. B510]
MGESRGFRPPTPPRCDLPEEVLDNRTYPEFLDHTLWAGSLFDGSWRPAATSRKVIEPATGEPLSQVGEATPADVETAAAAAVAAQRAWVAVSPRDRADIFRRAAALLETNLPELAGFVARETGGIPAKGEHELREAVTLFHLASGIPLQASGEMLPSAPGRFSVARRTPHGLVAVISPFNFPLILSLRAVAPALATGNAVLLKPDPQTPVSGGLIIARALELAGLPAGLLHVLPGGADVGEALVTHPAVGMVCFTGSTAVGRRIGELAGARLKKVSLELGGKNSLIVLDDADLDLAARNIAWGAYLHQGQICMASGRILVHRAIAADLIAKVAEKARHLPVGDPAREPAALGPLINDRQAAKVHAIVEDSVRAGAVLEAGGRHDGRFYWPTVLSGVRPGMRAFEEEVFGPVASFVTVASDDEAVELANRTEYGLSAAVLSPNLARAWAVAERLDAGMVHVNDQTVNDECVNPFSGRGCSGNGGSPSDWREYTRWQWLTVKPTAPAYPF